MQQRRQAVLRVAPELYGVLKAGRFEIIADPLPDDARLVSAGYDPWRNTVVLVFESEAFAPVPVGKVLPELPGPTMRSVSATGGQQP